MNYTLETQDDAEKLLTASENEAVLIFKHSNSCGTSAEAFEQYEQYLESADSPLTTGVVVVQTARDVSNFLAERLALRHESPQAILVRGGAVLWSASRFAITEDKIRAAVAKAQTV